MSSSTSGSSEEEESDFSESSGEEEQEVVVKKEEKKKEGVTLHDMHVMLMTVNEYLSHHKLTPEDDAIVQKMLLAAQKHLKNERRSQQ
jgi:hypothetical protein